MKKEETQLIVACLLVVVGAGLIIAGFIVEPVGIIDNSVLIAFGEIATFAGSLFGIDYHYRSLLSTKNC